MNKIEWNRFEVVNENHTKSFEMLCHYIFCRRFDVLHDIKADFNEAGLETEPILYNNEYHGYQAKYFENGMDYIQIKKSVLKALKKFNGRLNYIHIYYNCKAVLSRSKTVKEIEDEAGKYNVKILWEGGVYFQTVLNNPNYNDLAQLFFDLGDEIGFINDSRNKHFDTIVKSEEFINLPIKFNKEVSLELNELSTNFFKTNNIAVVTGNPGSGKSIFLNKLFHIYSGLDKGENENIINEIIKNNAIPVIINLKNCISKSLENYIQDKIYKYNLTRSKFKFIYILDGLDEISIEQADILMTFLKELNEKSNTKKVIISLRKLSSNRLLLKKYFKNVDEYIIDELNSSYLIEYFNRKNSEKKKAMLKNLFNINPQLVSDIKDILLIKLLWDSIQYVDTRSTIIDIINIKVKTILDYGTFKKNINILNLPDSKSLEIIKINKEIAFRMFLDFKLSLNTNEINNIVSSMYPKLDYKGVNDVVGYLCQTFLDISSISDEYLYCYQHRRYQEYFLSLKMKEEYEKNPSILRKYNLLANKDFFENFFIKFLKRNYEKELNISGLIELNLIDTYLGKNKNWGADRALYKYLDSFTLSVASQNEDLMNALMEDSNLPIKENLFITSRDVEDDIKEKENGIKCIPDTTEEMIQSLIRNIIIFWQQGKYHISDKLRQELKKIHELSTNNQILKKNFNRAINEEYKDFMFILLVIDNNSINDVLNNVKLNHENDKKYETLKSRQAKSIKAFFRVCLKNRLEDLIEILNELTDDEFGQLLATLYENKFIHLCFNTKIKHAIISRLQSVKVKNNIILAFIKFYDLPINQEDIEKLKSELSRLQNTRCMDVFSIYEEHDWVSILNYILKNEKNIFSYQNIDEKFLYEDIYSEYIEVIKGNSDISYIIKKYCDSTKYYNRKKGFNIHWWVVNIFSSIFSNIDIEDNKFYAYIKYLLKYGNDSINITILLKLIKINKEDVKSNLILDIISNSKKEEYSYSIQDNVDYYFIMAFLYSQIDDNFCVNFLIKGLNAGIVRHGWRKDTIVDVNLVKALKIMYDNSYFSGQELAKYTMKIVKMILYINTVTDESYRCDSFEEIIGTVAIYDINLCEEIIKILKNEKLITNDMIRVFLKNKISNGSNIEEIYEYISCFELQRDYENKVTAEVYIYTIDIYLTLLEVGWYCDKEQQILKNIDTQIKLLERWKLTEIYYYKDIYERYKKICMKYSRECRLSLREDDLYHKKALDNKNDETLVINEIDSIDNSKKLEDFYKKISGNSNVKIRLETKAIWINLIDKTYSFDGNIMRVLNYLNEKSYPDFSAYSENSKYMHLGLGYMLTSINYKQETINYLANNAGHDGFINIIKSYNSYKDNRMCKELFNRYVGFCEFLVYD